MTMQSYNFDSKHVKLWFLISNVGFTLSVNLSVSVTYRKLKSHTIRKIVKYTRDLSQEDAERR